MIASSITGFCLLGTMMAFDDQLEMENRPVEVRAGDVTHLRPA